MEQGHFYLATDMINRKKEVQLHGLNIRLLHDLTKKHGSLKTRTRHVAVPSFRR